MRVFPIGRAVAATLVCVAFVTAVNADDKSAAVQVTVDVSEVPDLKDWGDKAKALVEKWQPIIADLLKSDGFTPPSEVKIVFKKDMRGIAYTSGRTITIAARWVQKHPDDFGMVVHELTHAVQSYGRTPHDAGWVVEGMADYVRFFKYEPDANLGPINTGDAGYRDGYRTAAKFLDWITKTHDKDIVDQLNRAPQVGVQGRFCSKMPRARTWTPFGPSSSRP